MWIFFLKKKKQLEILMKIKIRVLNKFYWHITHGI